MKIFLTRFFLLKKIEDYICNFIFILSLHSIQIQPKFNSNNNQILPILIWVVIFLKKFNLNYKFIQIYI